MPKLKVLWVVPTITRDMCYWEGRVEGDRPLWICYTEGTLVVQLGDPGTDVSTARDAESDQIHASTNGDSYGNELLFDDLVYETRDVLDWETCDLRAPATEATLSDLRTVIVEMDGGLVKHVEMPAGVRVLVRDYDVNVSDVLNERVEQDAKGLQYVEQIWENEPE